MERMTLTNSFHLGPHFFILTIGNRQTEDTQDKSRWFNDKKKGQVVFDGF